MVKSVVDLVILVDFLVNLYYHLHSSLYWDYFLDSKYFDYFAYFDYYLIYLINLVFPLAQHYIYLIAMMQPN